MARILVVDDEESIRLLYQEELTDEGYEVETAANGEEALRKIQESKFDIVTLDIKMPGMSGLEVLKKIREVDVELPVILCTAFDAYRQDFDTWGSDSYVTKSADLDELKSEVRRILQRSR
ncbi:MAG: response regulator [Candidatus Hydrogenedentota bacterium]|nr:MAG: response regulator [Candidatus Hydrogenedentota bacterium]